MQKKSIKVVEAFMKFSRKKVLVSAAVLVVIIIMVFAGSLTSVKDYHDKYEGEDLSVDVDGLNKEGTYTAYQNQYPDAEFPQMGVEVKLLDYVSESDVSEYADYKGAVFTDDLSEVTWQVEIPVAGFYNIYMEYLTVESRGVAVERELKINGELPFADAAKLYFKRLWTNSGEVRTDNQGNEIRPAQVEAYEWQSTYFKDDEGYTTKPYQFYFKEGINEITLLAVQEPVVIRKLALTPVEDRVTYAEYYASRSAVTLSDEAASYLTKIQGEDSTVRSESSLYAKYDRSSPTTEPNSVTSTILNYIGGETWSAAGQFIDWEFSVPEDGYYNITIKARQNYTRGSVSTRSLYIDGVIPFAEVEAIQFEYNNDWNALTLCDENEEPYQFYLEAGEHTIRLEATLGDMGSILEELVNSTYRLNQMYRKILVYTGAKPDQYRDYNIQQVYPEVIETMDLEAKRLYKIIDDMVAYTGQKSDKIATAQTLAIQLERFAESPYKITVEFTNFKDNITALGTAMLLMSESKLDLDYIVVSGTEAEVEIKNANFVDNIWHDIKSFMASFTVDYESVGDVYEEGVDVVTVWVLSGRDQGTILKTMIDDSFTSDSGIKVNVVIGNADTLLSATISGNGPDVVISVGSSQPVNYAMRNAVEDLTQFAGWEEVFDVYYESAYTAYKYDGGIYGLPETQSFNVMFYRTDILEELGLEIPQTWTELIEMLPTLQGNNMEVGIPVATSTSSPDLSMYYALLYQLGGDVYNKEGTRTTIDEEAGVVAFDMYMKFFNDYGFPTIYDFVSRFRSGEMPIGIANFGSYNTLMVSAPEIKGLWEFALVPGTEATAENGETYIDRSVLSGGGATMMLKIEDETIKNNAWKFMKWWADTDTQVRYGREIESLLGSSARYATANTEAFQKLSWRADERAILEEQWSYTVGFREIAGGYSTGRHIVNAVRKVLDDQEDTRETLLEYTISINEELSKKRKEFGLTVE